jgi:hypothetical protein
MEKLDSTIVPGLTLRQPGESLETVTTTSGEFRLLAAAGNLEMQSIRLTPGKQLYFVPFDEDVQGAVEICYVVSGLLETALPSGTVRAGAGTKAPTSRSIPSAW